MTNTEAVLSYVKSRLASGQDTMYTTQVMNILKFVNFCDARDLEIIAIGHARLDGGNVTEIETAHWYEQGFAAKPRL